MKAITAAIEGLGKGKKSNVAIVGEPYSGKTTLLEEVRKSVAGDATVLHFDSAVTEAGVLEPLESPAPIAIADDCQFLYLRKIGGYWPLERFLAASVRSPSLFITAWNSYSWDYLCATFRLAHFFPGVVRMPKFTPGMIEQMIMSRYKEGEIRFVEDDKLKGPFPAATEHKPVSLGPFRLRLSIPKPDGRLIERLYRKASPESDREKTFKKIYDLSGGNPGVALVLWKKALSGNTIRSSDVRAVPCEMSLDFLESHLLSVILSVKSITADELKASCGNGCLEADEALYRLKSLGLLAGRGDVYCIRPEALRSVVKYLKKQRLVW